MESVLLPESLAIFLLRLPLSAVLGPLPTCLSECLCWVASPWSLVLPGRVSRDLNFRSWTHLPVVCTHKFTLGKHCKIWLTNVKGYKSVWFGQTTQPYISLLWRPATNLILSYLKAYPRTPTKYSNEICWGNMKKNIFSLFLLLAVGAQMWELEILITREFFLKVRVYHMSPFHKQAPERLH